MSKKLILTKETILKVIEKSIAIDGVEKAKENLDFLNKLFASEYGWAETKREADKMMITNIRKEKKVKHKEKLEELRARRPNVNIKLTAKAKAHQRQANNKVDQMVGIVKDGAKVVHHDFTSNNNNKKKK